MSLAKNYATQKWGYTRIIPIKYRDGDAAKLVKLELV
jgi:ribosomal protein L17